MKIIIKTKNLELTGELKDFINNRLGSLEKFIYPVKYRKAVISPEAKLFNRVKILKGENPAKGKQKTLAEIFVEVKRETRHHKKGDIFKTEAIIILPGKKLVAEAMGDDLNKTIIEVKDELQVEIKKYKTKKIELPRRKMRKFTQSNNFDENQ